MPTVAQIVSFLDRYNSLELGGSPWPTYEDSDEILLLDWTRLVEGEISGGFLSDLLGMLRSESGQPVDAPVSRSREPTSWDLCAWYQPIHFFGYDWGIFIREDCILKQALKYGLSLPARVRQNAGRKLAIQLIQAAVYTYFLHEHYHHKIESLGFRFHATTGTSRYLPYKNKVYIRTRGTDDQLEEALANADAFRRFDGRPYSKLGARLIGKFRKCLTYEFRHLDPPGYRKAVEYLDDSAFREGQYKLLSQVYDGNLRPLKPFQDWAVATHLTRSTFNITQNIYTIVPRGAKSWLPTRKVSPAARCSTQQMIKLYEKAGYECLEGSKHTKLRKPNSPTMVLPRNRKELSIGVLKNALQVLGPFSPDQLPDLLKGQIAIA